MSQYSFPRTEFLFETLLNSSTTGLNISSPNISGVP